MEFATNREAADSYRERGGIHYTVPELAYFMTRSAPMLSICPSCGCDQVRVFYEAQSAPVNSVLLLSSREQALTFPTGNVRLGFSSVRVIYNTSFDRRLVEYSAAARRVRASRLLRVMA